MPKVILVVLTDPRTARACLDAAQQAAGVLGDSRIVALAMRTVPLPTVLPSEEVLIEHQRSEIERRAEEGIAALRSAFDEWRQSLGPGSHEVVWAEARGDPLAEVERQGPAAELVVVSASSTSRDRAGSALNAAILHAHRPVLVMPDGYDGTIGRRVCIAWAEDGRAVKAVLAAMPFLVGAEHVWVLRAARASAAAAPRRPLPPILVEHEIRAEDRMVAAGIGVGAALLREAQLLAADLLVMGAYTHRPLIELLRGGVTRSVLLAARIPVLMQH
jgi:nucleotide-binding universal stress UspA family protein